MRLTPQQIEAAYEDPDAVLELSSEKVHDSSAAFVPPSRHVVHLPGELPLVRHREACATVRLWTNDIETSALRQIDLLSKLPHLHEHGLAIMPDVHIGKGACVGSVIPLRGALVAGSIGVDIGCGVCAVCLSLPASDLPDSLAAIRSAIEAAVPVGAAAHTRAPTNRAWVSLSTRYDALVHRYPMISSRTVDKQLGTLGGGNHFIEVCLDEKNRVWVMLHSGSRHAGLKIGEHFTRAANAWCRDNGERRPSPELGWLPEGTPLFEGYRDAMLWAQDYAALNRIVMLEAVVAVMHREVSKPFKAIGNVVSCHHNYASPETHFGVPLWVIRKGAIHVPTGKLGIVPGSMGTESFIVRGRGNPDAYDSCAHGAGRRMSRSEARATFTAKALAKQTLGVECRKDKGVVDEAPEAYKPIRDVMKNQQDLVDIVHTLKQIVCVKGG